MSRKKATFARNTEKMIRKDLITTAVDFAGAALRAVDPTWSLPANEQTPTDETDLANIKHWFALRLTNLTKSNNASKAELSTAASSRNELEDDFVRLSLAGEKFVNDMVRRVVPPDDAPTARETPWNVADFENHCAQSARQITASVAMLEDVVALSMELAKSPLVDDVESAVDEVKAAIQEELTAAKEVLEQTHAAYVATRAELEAQAALNRRQQALIERLVELQGVGE